MSKFDWIIPFFRLRHLIHKGSCEQNISRTAWTRIMIFGSQIVSNVIYRQNYVHIWLNYLPFLTLTFCVVKQPCEQNIWRTTWAGIMKSGIQFGYMMCMTWLTFHKLLSKFEWNILLFRLRHLTHKEPCKNISGERLELGSCNLAHRLCLRSRWSDELLAKILWIYDWITVKLFNFAAINYCVL